MNIEVTSSRSMRISRPASSSRRLGTFQRSQSMSRITDLRRGKLAWEIMHSDTTAYDPESFKLQLWDMTLCAFVLYDVWAVSVLICINMLNPGTCDQKWVATTAMAFEVFFLADIYVQMHTGYYLLGNLVRHAASARRHYLLSWHFLLDMVALVPLSFMPSVASSTASCGLLLVNKLLRTRRIAGYALVFDKVFAQYFKCCKVVKVVVVTCLFCHVMGCVYAAFGKASNDVSNEGGVWRIHVTASPGRDQLLTEYLAALFWALGMISKCLEGEIPRTLWQTVFTLVVMLGGFLLFVYICGTLFMVSKCNANSVERFTAKVNQLRHVLSYHHVPKSIQDRAVEFLENGFKSGEANDLSTMKLFCPSISKDMKYTFLKDTVANVPFFKCCSAAFVRALIDLMETQSLPTNYIVCDADEQYEDMYFVQSGLLVVLRDDFKVQNLRRGDFFGELSLFSKQMRSTSVVTVTFCMLYKLSRANVSDVLREYPQFESQILSCVKLLVDAHVREKSTCSGRFSSHKSTTVTSESSYKRRMAKRFVEIFPVAHGGKVAPEPEGMQVRPIDTLEKYSLRGQRNRMLLSFAINRKSRWRLTWLLSIMATSLYNIYTVPLLNAFQLIGYPFSVEIVNMFADAILWLDIYGNFNLSFMFEGEQVFDTQKCASHYLHSSFAFDVVCAFPWWIFFPLSWHLKVRFVRLFRLYCLNAELEEVALFVRINSRCRIVILGIGLVLCYHIAGCMAQAWAVFIGYGDNEHGWLPPKTLQLVEVYSNTTGNLIGYNWMEGTRFVPVGDPFVRDVIVNQYTRAVQYGAVCLTNLGLTHQPNSLGEYVLAFLLMLCGMLLISTIIDEVQKRVTASAIEQMEFLSTRSRILHFLHKQKVPQDIHKRVDVFLEFWWSVHRGANINALLGELPMSIRREIFMHMCAPTFNIVKQMKDVGEHYGRVSSLLVDNLVVHLHGQGEFIYQNGDYAGALYFLLAGEARLSANFQSPGDMPLRFVKPGEQFGSSSLQLGKTCIAHSENAVAHSACVVASVGRAALVELNKAFPSFCSNLAKEEKRMLTLHRFTVKLIGKKGHDVIKHENTAGTIDPDSTLSVLWETFLFFGMVIQTASVPLFMSFGFFWSGLGIYDILSIVLEICFVINIVLKARTGYYAFGNKVRDLVKIRKRYFLSHRFLVDILAVLPFNLVNVFVANRSEAWNFNKMLRLFTLSSQIEHLERHYFKIKIQIRLLKLVFYVLFLAHYVGCTWYNFANQASTIFGYIHQTKFGHDSWLPGEEMDLSNHHTTTAFKYTQVFYWGLGLLLGFYPGAYPETPLERVFTVVIQTTGVFLLAYVIGNLLDIVEVTEGNNRILSSNLNFVRKLTKYFRFSNDTKSNIQHFYFYSHFHSIHEEHVLTKCLPSTLVADIRLFLLTPMLKKVPFFLDENATPTVTRSLVRHLSQVLVTRHEVVCRQDEIGAEMFFVFIGCLGIYITLGSKFDVGVHDMEMRHKGIKVNELHAGMYFGERSLFSDKPRNATIVAKTFCTLYRLSRTHLQTVFVHHPGWKERVMDIVDVIYPKQEIDHAKTKQVHLQTLVQSSVGKRTVEATAKTRANAPAGLFALLTSRRLSFFTLRTFVLYLVRSVKASIFGDVQVHSTFYCVHMISLCVALLYVAIGEPYCLVFVQSTKSAWLIVLSIATDIVFAYDIWFKLHLRETDASREFYDVAPRVETTEIVVDIIAILPFDYFFSMYLSNVTVLRLNRLLKLRQLMHTIHEIQRFSLSYEVNRLKLLALYYFIICHWTACAYFGLTFVDGFSTQWNSSLPVTSFNSSSHSGDFAFAVFQYLRCLYFALSVYTGSGIVYEPTTTLQFAFIALTAVFGVFVMAYVIGEGSTFSIFLIQHEVDFKINQMHVMEFLARKHVDATLRSRVFNFLASWWAVQDGVTYQSTFHQLPPHIRAQAFVDIARKSVLQFAWQYLRPLVHNTSTSVDVVVLSIARRLVYNGYPAGESVIVQGNIGRSMYFVSRGTLVSASTTPKFVSSQFEDGQYFGDQGFLAGTFYRYSVVTLRACDLLALSGSDFLAALGEHRRTTECCLVAKHMVARPRTGARHDSNVGSLVRQIIQSNQLELPLLQSLSVEAAEVTFLAFLRLFTSPGIETTISIGASDVCQHCDDTDAVLYCSLCVQALCEACCRHIHESSPHFAFHRTSITRLKDVPLSNTCPATSGATPPAAAPPRPLHRNGMCRSLGADSILDDDRQKRRKPNEDRGVRSYSQRRLSSSPAGLMAIQMPPRTGTATKLL
ncbi:Aste57867_14044 [Aphanomyces stellatus]|uniref:Aste57867_14044 protein n=1 Tax=Aphanomyces stellatus TaxID=120398 RepID=A0A485L1C0_9STRA|nr:hypothetical protein As57867_013993 [Aphanomyces stellatus]VFT90874.1 Aste57867_14044 [Aphanomyces stellatus]